MNSRTSKILNLAKSVVNDSTLMPNDLEHENECSDAAIFEAKGSPSSRSGVITKQVELVAAKKKIEKSWVSESMDCFNIIVPLLDEMGISNEVEVENERNDLEKGSTITKLGDNLDYLESLSDNELLSVAQICEKNLRPPEDVIYSESAAGLCTLKIPTNPNEIEKIESEEVDLIHKDIPTNDNEDLPLNNDIENKLQINKSNNNEEVENLEDTAVADELVAPNRPTKRKRENVKKRLCKPETWKINQRKKMYQSGKEYISVRGKSVSAKKVVNKKDCLRTCKFSCGKKIGETERKSIFELYYSFTQNEKYLFLKSTTERYLKGRRTVDHSRRSFTFRYFFTVREERLRVCKLFFLSTLNISQKPVYTAHSVESENTPKKNMRGKTGSRKIYDETKNIVMDHISKFPVLESHYCRASSNKKYLEATLSVSKMYDLYLEHCNENNVANPVKLSMYRHIFNTNFNLSFHKPKKDVCERCSRYYLRKKENNLDEEEEEEMTRHMAEKTAMRAEKDRDKKSEVPVLCFDLENVITCPRSYVGNHFYLPKLSMYNLTAHLSSTNTVYCVIWIETMQGRTGNCLASAFRKIVDKILEDNNIEHLITWSDSCVPQNRNSFISFCVLDILRQNPDLQSLTMKYSVPGHGAVQEVDNVHSQIERHMALKEFYSPVGFIKELKNVNKKRPFVIMQMKTDDFKNFEECASKMNYNRIPFTKVTSMRFKNSDVNYVEYKLSHTEEDFSQKSLIHDVVPRLTRKNKTAAIPQPLNSLIPKTLQKTNGLSKEKVQAIKKMMACMPHNDQLYYKAIFHL